MAERFQLSYDERFFAYAQLAQRALPAPLIHRGAGMDPLLPK
jgi:hypothetical protein